MTYGASTIKRATTAEMEERAQFFYDYAEKMHPVTVRQLYYQAEVAGLTGIGKTEQDYRKVQRQILKMRRDGVLPYHWITDGTRMRRKPRSFNGIHDAMEEMRLSYRKALWAYRPTRVEIWLEKDALAGVVYPVTAEFDVSLMVSRGQTSETFAYDAVAQYINFDGEVHFYSFYDFDKAGLDSSTALESKIARFADEMGVDAHFHAAALSAEQVQGLRLPTRPPKVTKNWRYDHCAELDAIAPDDLRAMVTGSILNHLPEAELAMLREQEAREIADMQNMEIF